MKNRYKQYYCLPGRISSSRLIYDDGSLRIEGRDQSGSVLIEFLFEEVLLVRITDEGIRLKLQRDLGAKRAIAFLDEQSDLTDWLRQESLCTRDFEGVKHYILFIGEEAFDVVSSSEPLISQGPVQPGSISPP
jgi:hypothetical protein